MNISKKFYPCGFWGNEHFSAEKWLMCDITYDDDNNEVESNHKPMFIRAGSAGEIQMIDNPDKLVPDLILTIGATTWRFKPNLALCNYASRQVVNHPAALTYNFYKNLNFAGWGGVKYEAEDVNCPWVIMNSMQGAMIFDMSTFNNPSTSSYNRWLTPTSNNFGSSSESTGTIYVIRKTNLNKVLLKPYNTSTLDANFLTYIWPLIENEYCKEFYYISCTTYGTLTKSDNALTDAGSLAPDMGTQFKSYWKLNAKTGVFEWQDTVNSPPSGYDANIIFGAEVWSVTNPAGKRVARFIYNKNQEKFVLWKYASGTNVSTYYSTYTFNPSYFYNIKQEEFVEDGETKKRWCYYMWNKPKGAVFTYQAASYDGTVPQWYTSGLDSFVFTFKKFLPAHDAWTYVNWTLVKESNYVNPFNYTNNGTADADNVASSTARTTSYFEDHYWADMNDRYFNIITGEDFK